MRRSRRIWCVDCFVDADCDNGLFCDGAETCQAGALLGGDAAVSVDDGVTCTDDSCDEVNDVVVNTPNDAETATTVSSAMAPRRVISSTGLPGRNGSNR